LHFALSSAVGERRSPEPSSGTRVVVLRLHQRVSHRKHSICAKLYVVALPAYISMFNMLLLAMLISSGKSGWQRKFESPVYLICIFAARVTYPIYPMSPRQRKYTTSILCSALQSPMMMIITI
jgi:hypothetical protein